MANVVYNSFKRDIMNGTIDLDTDTIRVVLMTSAYTPDQDADEFWDDIDANETTGISYETSGQVLSATTVSADDVDDEGVFDAADVTWFSSTITARGAVLFKDTGDKTSSPLIAYIDFGSDKSSSIGDFIIQWNAEGILNLN